MKFKDLLSGVAVAVGGVLGMTSELHMVDADGSSMQHRNLPKREISNKKTSIADIHTSRQHLKPIEVFTATTTPLPSHTTSSSVEAGQEYRSDGTHHIRGNIFEPSYEGQSNAEAPSSTSSAKSSKAINVSTSRTTSSKSNKSSDGKNSSDGSSKAEKDSNSSAKSICEGDDNIICKGTRRRRKIYICHFDKKKETFYTMCVTENAAMRRFAKQPKDFCGICKSAPSPKNYDPEVGSKLELGQGISAIIPPGFFENQAGVNAFKTNAYNESFAETALIHRPINKLPYMLQVTSDSQPATEKYSKVELQLPSDFTSRIPDDESIGVFFRMLQSSNSSGIFSVFALASSTYDNETEKLKFWMPSYAFTSNAGSSYEATIAVASRAGPGSKPLDRRLSSHSKATRCQAVSIRCPLGIGGCGDDMVTSSFSMSRTIMVNGAKIIAPHWGVDYFADIGDEVFAAADGVIEFSGLIIEEGSGSGFGETIVLRHSDGSATLYAHMSSLVVSLGSAVAAGSVIGYVGSTGSAIVPHLHLEYVPTGAIYKSDFRIDPHPCTQPFSRGSISVGDSGPDPDDIFFVYIDDTYLGATDVGQTNNLAVNGYLPGEYSLKIYVADDGDDIGTFHVEMFDGFLFDDGSTVKDWEEFPYLEEGESITFRFTVPESFSGDDDDNSCDDGNSPLSKGKCAISCYGQHQVLLPAQLGQCQHVGSQNTNCCYSTPQCYELGGKCMSRSVCGSGSYIVDSKCPGGSDIQCCVPEDTCSMIGGQCTTDCGAGEYDSFVTCSNSNSVCCITSHNCRGVGEFAPIDGYCTEKSQCSGDRIPAGHDNGCAMGVDDVECCIPSPPCTFISHGMVYNSGTCRVECNPSEKEFDSQQPLHCEKCCAIDPDPPEILVSTRAESLTFESSLIDTTFINEVAVQHKVQLSVVCVSVGGKVHPKLAAADGRIVEQDFDKTNKPEIKSQLINDGNDLMVHWTGNSWDGGEYERAADELNEFGDAITVMSPLNLKDILPKKEMNMLLEGLVRNKAAGSAHLIASTWYLHKAASAVGNMLAIHWIAKEYMDVRAWWLYRRNIVFRCEESSDDGLYHISSSEIEGPGGSYPMVDHIYGRAGDLVTKHERDALYGPIKKYQLPTEDSRALTSYQHFAVSTRLQKHCTFCFSSVMEHHEFIVAASCKKDDGHIIHAGTIGPFIRTAGQSWWDMFDEQIPQMSAPSVDVRYSKYDDRKLVIHTQGIGYNGETNTLSLGFAIASVIGLAVDIIVPIAVATGVMAAPLTFGTSVAVSAAALALGLIVASIVDEMEADYSFGYERAIILQCQEDSSGKYSVRRLGENSLNQKANVCYSLATLDSGDEDKYYLEIDNASSEVDGDGFARNYVSVLEPDFVIQKEECNFSMLTQGELGLVD